MISVGFKTDKGMVRSGNEDSIFVLPDQQLYIVADGVGGHNSGELASRMTVGYIAQYAALNPIREVRTDKELKEYFQKCYDGANDLVYGKSCEQGGHLGMATTCVMCYLRDDTAYAVNVGDSRCYLIRNGKLLQITEDHSAVQMLINQGLITKEEAETHPDKNMITKAVGGESTVQPDFYQFEISPEDIIILCTDGLYGEVDGQKILEYAEMSKEHTMRWLARALVDEANINGGKDNVSVVCIKIG